MKCVDEICLGPFLASLLATTTPDIFSIVKPPVTVRARKLERRLTTKPQVSWPSPRQKNPVDPEHVHPLEEVVAFKTFLVVLST